jgi:hypothetical protein
MSADMTNLRNLLIVSAYYLRRRRLRLRGKQETVWEANLYDAFRLCSGVPGDGDIAREVFRRRSHYNGWCHHTTRTGEELFAHLRYWVITDEDLEETFGPQWLEIVALVRAISAVTLEQIEKMVPALDAVRDAAPESASLADWVVSTWTPTAESFRLEEIEKEVPWDAAVGAAWVAAHIDHRDFTYEAAGNAAQNAAVGAAWLATWPDHPGAARDPARDAARDTAQGAAMALSVRHLIGQHGFTQAHYDILTDPWRQVMGQLHPDDEKQE